MILGLRYNHLRPRWEFTLRLSSSCVPPRGTQAEDPPEWKINRCLSERELKELCQAEDPWFGNQPVSPRGFVRLKTLH